jgi:hypothetical protein
MELPNQELTKPLLQGHPKLPDDQILGLAKKTKRKIGGSSLTYQLTKNPDLALLNKAFDILFEETLKKSGDLTSYDN